MHCVHVFSLLFLSACQCWITSQEDICLLLKPQCGVKLLSLFVLLGRFDFSSLLTSVQKCHKCFMWSKDPDRKTSKERIRVYNVPSLSRLLLFINLNSKLTSRDRRWEPPFSSGYILSAGILNPALWLWSLPQIQWAAKSTGDGDRDRPLWALSTGQSAVDKNRVCLAKLISSPLPLVSAFLLHSFETFGSARKIMSDLRGIAGQHHLTAGV